MNYSNRRDYEDDFILSFDNKKTRKNEYNGLTDPNLSSFFASPARKKLLLKQRLVKNIQILTNGVINERECIRNITLNINDKEHLPKISATPAPKRKKNKKNKKTVYSTEPGTEKKKENKRYNNLPPIVPISSDQFKDLITKQRDIIGNHHKNMKSL